MFIRRLYYNSAGEVLHSYMMVGDIKPLSAAEEAARFGLEDWLVMQWDTFDDDVEAKFLASYNRVSVDLSGDEPTLVFDFSELPVEETEADDMKNALSILGVEVESNG